MIFPIPIGVEEELSIEKETYTIYLNRFSDKAVFLIGRPLCLCIFLIKTVKFEHNLCIVWKGFLHNF